MFGYSRVEILPLELIMHVFGFEFEVSNYVHYSICRDFREAIKLSLYMSVEKSP